MTHKIVRKQNMPAPEMQLCAYNSLRVSLLNKLFRHVQRLCITQVLNIYGLGVGGRAWGGCVNYSSRVNLKNQSVNNSINREAVFTVLN